MKSSAMSRGTVIVGADLSFGELDVRLQEYRLNEKCASSQMLAKPAMADVSLLRLPLGSEAHSSA
jgi:hypothetical protein